MLCGLPRLHLYSLPFDLSPRTAVTFVKVLGGGVGWLEKCPQTDPTAKSFQKRQQRGAGLKRQLQVTRRHVEHVVCAWAEEVGVSANDQRDPQGNDNQDSPEFPIFLRNRDHAGDRKQINQNHKRTCESWEVWLNFNNQHEMPHGNKEMSSDNRRAPEQQLPSEIGSFLPHRNLRHVASRLHVVKKSHEPEIHVQLLVAVKEREPWIVGNEIHLCFLVLSEHHDIFEHSRCRLSGKAG